MALVFSSATPLLLIDADLAVSAASEHQWASQGVPGSVMIAKPFAAAQLVVAVSTLLVASSPGG